MLGNEFFYYLHISNQSVDTFDISNYSTDTFANVALQHFTVAIFLFIHT